MFLTRDEMDYVSEVLDGLYDYDQLLTEFREFMHNEFGVKVYCFFCDGASKTLYKNRLRYIVDDADIGKFTEMPWGNSDLEKEKKIKNAFSELCIKHKQYVDFADPSEFFAVASEFESDFRSDVMSHCSYEIDSYLKTVGEVKKTNCHFGDYRIFYELDTDVKRYEESGLSEQIAEKIFSIIKAHDRYNVFKERRVFFESVQTLNEKYGGSLVNYYR